MNNRGMALITVMVICVTLISFAGILFFQISSQNHTQPKTILQTKAMMAARGALQMAIYKFRVLPNEFYYAAANSDTAVNASADTRIFDAWLEDLNSTTDDSSAKKLADSLKTADGMDYQLGIEEFRLISKKDQGYYQDFVSIKAWGNCEGERRVLQELIEVGLTHDTP